MRLLRLGIVTLTLLLAFHATEARQSGLASSNCVKQELIESLDAYLKPSRTRNKLTYPTHMLKVVRSDGAHMGYIQYGEMGPHDISIEIVKVSKKYKGKGLSKILLAAVLKQRPDTQSIFAMLEFDNLKIFKEGLKKGLSEVDALKATPMYKAAAGFGYSKMIQHGTNGKVYFILEKP